MHYHKFQNDKYGKSVENTYRGKLKWDVLNTHGYQEYPLFLTYVHSTFKEI